MSPARIQILDLSIKAVINLLSILTAQIFAEFLFWDPHAGICWNSGLVHQKMPLVGCTGIPTPLPTWICSGQCKQPPVWGEESFGCEGSRGSKPGEEEFCQQRARGFVLRKEKIRERRSRRARRHSLLTSYITAPFPKAIPSPHGREVSNSE